jgi:hypothetical protein
LSLSVFRSALGAEDYAVFIGPVVIAIYSEVPAAALASYDAGLHGLAVVSVQVE